MKTILDYNEDIKTYWADEYGHPPYNHAEDSTLKKFAKKMNIDINEAKAILDENNIHYKVSDTLKVISRKNNISPQELYELIE